MYLCVLLVSSVPIKRVFQFVTMEEDDLYDFVFGNDYSTINKEPSTSSAKPEEVKETKENPDYAALFHKLLTGSRSQINKLKSENEELKKK